MITYRLKFEKSEITQFSQTPWSTLTNADSEWKLHSGNGYNNLKLITGDIYHHIDVDVYRISIWTILNVLHEAVYLHESKHPSGLRCGIWKVVGKGNGETCKI